MMLFGDTIEKSLFILVWATGKSVLALRGVDSSPSMLELRLVEILPRPNKLLFNPPKPNALIDSSFPMLFGGFAVLIWPTTGLLFVSLLFSMLKNMSVVKSVLFDFIVSPLSKPLSGYMF